MADKVPRLVAHVDVRKFKLDPMDGFLLTRIDGRAGPKELARETGLPDFSVERSLEKLEKLGIVEIIDPSAPPPPRAAPVEKKSAIAEYGVSFLEAKYDAKELEEDCELPMEQRKRVLDMFYRLEDLDHYTLLGITREADKKGVKRAYFEHASVMHPDKYFKKKLGSFKPKMEQLFNRITEAHDTLVDVARRADYDGYLDEVATTRGMEAMLERAMNEAAAQRPPSEAPPNSAPPLTVPPAARQSYPDRMTPVGPSPEDMKARREALARRLLGGGNSVRPPTQSTVPRTSDRPSPLRYSNPSDAMDALKRRYEERVDNATLAQAKKYLQVAEDALAKKDVVAAASAFSIATKFAPDDAALAMRYQEIKNQADAMLCESYAKQAQYEERSGHWAEAARNWQKVAKIKVHDAQAHERAAHGLWKAEGGDLHQAAEHAKQAITVDPSTITHHVTLAEIYLKADLHASARRAAEVGLVLDPKNVVLQAVVKRATK